MNNEQAIFRAEPRASFARVDFPIVGELVLLGDRVGSELVLRGVYFAHAPHAALAISEDARDAREDAAAFDEVTRQLTSYFEGTRTAFELTLAPCGTPFQREVWRALAAIPYGTTTTYAAIARAIGRPKAVRAVGAANGKNPLAIVVPCHRVIGRGGALTGYAGGVAYKRALLDLEARN
jgi:methylated-DNA-[protein]-cysteine S-methyltransferase